MKKLHYWSKKHESVLDRLQRSQTVSALMVLESLQGLDYYHTHWSKKGGITAISQARLTFASLRNMFGNHGAWELLKGYWVGHVDFTSQVVELIKRCESLGIMSKDDIALMWDYVRRGSGFRGSSLRADEMFKEKIFVQTEQFPFFTVYSHEEFIALRQHGGSDVVDIPVEFSLENAACRLGGRHCEQHSVAMSNVK